MLETVDLAKSLDKSKYQKAMAPLQDRLRRLQYELREAEIATVVVVEGWDAAGKSSTIQRLAEKLDPRAFRAYPGSPPSELERRYHWLWRYEVRLPEDGQMAFFDHSWYGRVLVERVEKFVRKHDWKIAFEQINEFERWLADDGQVLVKLWFHISKKEQKHRLARLEKDPAEAWKVSKEDWRRNRNHDKWAKAVEDMLAKTDTPHAPWTLVEATDYRWARVRVFETLVKAMESALQKRQQAPASVSRTHMAAEVTKVERARRAKDSLALATATAEEAGLPLEGS